MYSESSFKEQNRQPSVTLYWIDFIWNIKYKYWELLRSSFEKIFDFVLNVSGSN